MYTYFSVFSVQRWRASLVSAPGTSRSPPSRCPGLQRLCSTTPTTSPSPARHVNTPACHMTHENPYGSELEFSPIIANRIKDGELDFRYKIWGWYLKKWSFSKVLFGRSVTFSPLDASKTHTVLGFVICSTVFIFLLVAYKPHSDIHTNIPSQLQLYNVSNWRNNMQKQQKTVIKPVFASLAKPEKMHHLVKNCKLKFWRLANRMKACKERLHHFIVKCLWD